MRPPPLLSLVLSAWLAPALAAESFQPRSHVTRGLYAHIHRALDTSVWDAWGSGYAFVQDEPHGGRACVRCESKAGTMGQGVSQTIELKQSEPKPVRIAGWSCCRDVKGERSYRYSLYLDFTLADGTSWPMKLAPFAPGTHGWQFSETTVTPPKPIRTARFHAFLRETDGVAWFDDLFFGEAGGPNLLRCPGFEEADRLDRGAREKLFADLTALHCNALHGYLSSGLEDWDAGPTDDSEVLRFLRAARDRGIGVWLTIGLGGLPIRDATDPHFPQYYCVNGDWGRRWSAKLASIARFPFAGLSMTPDEYNWNTHRFKRRYLKHRDPKVRQFYKQMPTYCTCPVCKKRFREQTGDKLPVFQGSRLPAADERHRQWLAFRYDSTTAWLKRTCAAVKKANPAIRTDSLVCVTPLCSDFWYGPGIAWDRAGYEAGLEYPTTDPYILLHNYLGDSTHWYVTETAEHLAAASPRRRCGVVLEASRLRPEHRELDPVEVYGSALSAVWHGADELAFWHHIHVTGQSGATEKPAVSHACVAGLYGLLERIDPWLDGMRPEPGVALLFSRASCDWWRIYTEAKDTEPPFDTWGVTDPRYASILQKEVLYALLRKGYPVSLYYLENVRRDELKDHPVVFAPFPLAIGEEQARLIQDLHREGKHVVIGATDGPLAPDGTPRATPALFHFIRGDEEAKSLAQLTGSTRRRLRSDFFAPATHGGAKGRFVFLPHCLLAHLMANRQNEKRTRTERIAPSPWEARVAFMLYQALAFFPPQPYQPLLSDREPEGDDLELCLSVNRRGERLFLAINWDAKERSVTLPERPCFGEPPAEAYLLGPDGTWAPWKGALRPVLALLPQQALVARLRAGDK